MRLVIERAEDRTWVCETEPWAWGYGWGETPEEAVADLRSMLCEARKSGWFRDRGWPERHGARAALRFIEGRVSVMDRWHALWARIVRWWVE